jgi:hypothetical protein
MTAHNIAKLEPAIITTILSHNIRIHMWIKYKSSRTHTLCTHQSRMQTSAKGHSKSLSRSLNETNLDSCTDHREYIAVEHHRDIDCGCHAPKEACCEWQSLHHQVPHKKIWSTWKKRLLPETIAGCCKHCRLQSIHLEIKLLQFLYMSHNHCMHYNKHHIILSLSCKYRGGSQTQGWKK